MKNTESGNVLFYILIAVALLATLTIAVSQGGRGSANQISEERARLYAGEILEYANIMSSAVSQLRLRGVTDDLLCFDHTQWGADDYDHAGCTDNFNRLFHPEGAGLEWVRPPPEAMDTTASPDNLWHIYGDNEIENIGTTSGAAGSSDLILLVDELSQNVCEQINQLLGHTEDGDSIPQDTGYGETRYIGAFAYSETIVDEASGTALDGKSEGCFEDTTNNVYAFYKVLIAR